jgi:hypothetical protein
MNAILDLSSFFLDFFTPVDSPCRRSMVYLDHQCAGGRFHAWKNHRHAPESFPFWPLDLLFVFQGFLPCSRVFAVLAIPSLVSAGFA